MGRVKVNWCDSKEAEAYVASRKWEALGESAKKLFTRHRGNNVWLTDIAPFGKVVVKMSHLDSSFSLFERIGRELRFRLFDVDLRDAQMALRVEQLGVPTYHPLAVWEVRKGLQTSCYIMYTYVEGRSLKDICKDGAFDEADRPAVKGYLRKLGKLARRLHDGGLRHRDLVPGNVVIRPDGTLAIIDFASGYPAHRNWERYRRTQDFASLRRLAHIFDADCLAAFSEGYCGTGRGSEYEHALFMMLFWKYNGRRTKSCWNRLRLWRAMQTARGIK